jgi:hypothetical protein
MRDLTETELELVSGGQQTNTITATLLATPPKSGIAVQGSGAGLSFALETVTGPGHASTSATITEINSTP